MGVSGVKEVQADPHCEVGYVCKLKDLATPSWSIYTWLSACISFQLWTAMDAVSETSARRPISIGAETMTLKITGALSEQTPDR